MTPLDILLLFFSILLIVLLLSQFNRIVRIVKRISTTNTAQNIQIVQYDDPSESESQARTRMDLELRNDTVNLDESNSFVPPESFPDEKRKYPRKPYKTNVEFIGKGTLFKETSRDISYSGIFLKSKMPDKYKLDEIIMLTFQTSKGAPQKRNGRVVRKTSRGIGIHFIKTDEN